MTGKSNTKRSENALNFEGKASKPAQLAKIIYAGLVRLKATKESRECGRNCPKGLDFGQPERVNAVAEVDKLEIKRNDKGKRPERNQTGTEAKNHEFE
jgi:hypothetical protein